MARPESGSPARNRASPDVARRVRRGAHVLDELAWAEALLLAVILAPTDAALGQVVVTSRRLPSRVRQSLNVESGLNDGMCVSLFFIVLAVAQAQETDAGLREAAQLVLEELGCGALAGVIAGTAAAAVVILAGRRGFIARSWSGAPGSLPPSSAVRSSVVSEDTTTPRSRT